MLEQAEAGAKKPQPKPKPKPPLFQTVAQQQQQQQQVPAGLEFDTPPGAMTAPEETPASPAVQHKLRRPRPGPPPTAVRRRTRRCWGRGR